MNSMNINVAGSKCQSRLPHTWLNPGLEPTGEAWIAVSPHDLPAFEQVVVGWHDELESPVVIFYDNTFTDGDGPRWSVCADGGEFPLAAITHWRRCAKPASSTAGERTLIIEAPYCTLQMTEDNFVDHLHMRAAALREVLGLMVADEPDNFMLRLCARLSEELDHASVCRPNALLLAKQMAAVLLAGQGDGGAGPALWLCRQIVDELLSVLGAMTSANEIGGAA